MDEDFINLIESAIDINDNKKPDAERFLCEGTSYFRYVIGKNDQSALLIRKYKIDGLIDDFAAAKTFWNGVPVVKSSDIPINSIVVNCSTSISPVSVTKNLSKPDSFKVLQLHELITASKDEQLLPQFVVQMRNDYKQNASEWLKLYHFLSDDESRKNLVSIMRYRLTANSVYMSDYRVRLKEQYLEDFMKYCKEIFVDIGGFDGDTTEEFCKRFPDYKKVFIFEPSPANILAARKRLEFYKNIDYITSGLSDEPGKLFFNPDAGSASSILENGYSTIDVTTLDLSINEPVTFIKMDIEGWELKALAGSRNHIIRDHPKLAIAVYHNSDDFYKIPWFVFSINPNYKLYLRHYTEGWSESVMYFLPV